MIKGKKIIIAISGGIAAYKIPFLIRLLKKGGANVKVVCTPYTLNFVTPLTLSTLSENPVLSTFYSENDGSWNSHIDLGSWADLMIFAPLTANTMAKMANGQADNLLVATYLSARCPVLFAPAMDLDMFKHPSTQRNIELLKKDGNFYIPPDEGQLASGLFGPDRLPEPQVLFEKIQLHLSEKKNFRNKRVLITAGPTFEAIDPVRFIGNHSSGKMGFALAEEFAHRGADVTVIGGPVYFPESKVIKFISVTSAQDMYDQCMLLREGQDIIIMAAAVADIKPINQANEKIKKEDSFLEIKLEKTKDILSELGKRKTDKQLLVGFSLETENEIINAKKKLKNKNLDMIVLNSLQDKGAGFGTSTNKITIFDKDGNQDTYPLKSKAMVAKDVADYILEMKVV